MARLGAILLVVLAGVFAQPPISSQNWLQHPQIQAIRKVVSLVQQSIAQNTLQLKQQQHPCGERWLYQDRQGVVRFYRIKVGSDDSAYTLEHTYDPQGVLLFVFVRAGAVNGAVREERYYFQTDQLLWQNTVQNGPGYPFMASDQLIATQPWSNFAASLCR